MVAEYLEFLLSVGFPQTLNLLNSFKVAPGVSWLGLSVAVILLSTFIGSILMRV